MDKPANETTARTTALLVAASYNCLPEEDALPGTTYDLNVMKDITEKLRFKDVKKVEGQNATKANILESLRILSSEAKPGNVVLFYFSGHGYYLPRTKDEGLIPADATVEKLEDAAEDTCITGRDLLPFWEQLAQKKVRLTVIFDCCYSGQLYRVVDLRNKGCTDIIPRQVVLEKSLNNDESQSAAKSEETGNKLLRGGWTPGEEDTFFYIAACSPVQLACEFRGQGGILTMAIESVFKSINSREKQVSINAFFRLIEREFKEKGWDQIQTPQLEGTSLYTELFGVKTCQEPFEKPGIKVNDVNGEEVILDAGCLQDLLPGNYYVFETTFTETGDDLSEESSDWLGSIDVTEGGIGQIESSGLIAKRSSDTDKEIKSGCLAFLKTPFNIKANAWVDVTPGSVPDENVKDLVEHMKKTNILNVYESKPSEIEDKDLITIGFEPYGPSSEKKEVWVARRRDNIIVPPLHLGLEKTMAENLSRYLRYQSALASAQPPKSEYELLKDVNVEVLKIEKVKPFTRAASKKERIQEGLKHGKDLYQDPSKYPVLLSHSLSEPKMNKLIDQTGDAFLFQVANHNKEDTVHICVLFYQFDGAIKVIYPPKKGSTIELRGGDTAEDIFRVFIPFNSLRKMAQPDPSKSEPDRGVDTIVVYATSKPADFGPLLQTAIETDPDLIARGKEEKGNILSDLAKFSLPIKQRCLEDHDSNMDLKWFVEKKEFAVEKNTNESQGQKTD